jgi:predicted PurR-regulated permease PerM
MDILRNLVGNLTAGIIRLLVTVGILAAAYFFIVKPVLKSADNAVNKTNGAFEKSFGANGLNDLSKALDSVSHQVQVQVQRSFHTARRNGSPKKLVRCVEKAQGNVHRIRRCTVKF